MLAFILRRVLQSAIVLAVVAFIAFGLFNFTGDPVSFMVGQDATMEEKQQVRKDLGLDRPFYIQFARFISNAATGDFGRSLRQSRKVSDLFRERLPATLELSFVAAALALVVGIPAGVYTALKRQSWSANLLLAASLIGVSLPTFLIGILLILVFAVYLGWLPSFGRGDTVALGWWTTGFLTASGLKALILPSITLSLFQMTLIMRLVRAEMLEVLRTDYIKFARARGLTDRAIHFGHALKNTLVPVITITGLQLGAIIAGGSATQGHIGTIGGLGHFSIGIRGNGINGSLPDIDRIVPSAHGAEQSTYTITDAGIGLPTGDVAVGLFNGLPLGITHLGGLDLLVSAAYLPSYNNSSLDISVPSGSWKADGMNTPIVRFSAARTSGCATTCRKCGDPISSSPSATSTRLTGIFFPAPWIAWSAARNAASGPF